MSKNWFFDLLRKPSSVLCGRPSPCGFPRDEAREKRIWWVRRARSDATMTALGLFISGSRSTWRGRRWWVALINGEWHCPAAKAIIIFVRDKENNKEEAEKHRWIAVPSTWRPPKVALDSNECSLSLVRCYIRMSSVQCESGCCRQQIVEAEWFSTQTTLPAHTKSITVMKTVRKRKFYVMCHKSPLRLSRKFYLRPEKSILERQLSRVLYCQRNFIFNTSIF